MGADVVAARDEGELESPKLAKDPEEQNPDLEDEPPQSDQVGGWKTEFPGTQDPDRPDPIPRDPGGD
jgi:hypothetical protein